MPKTNNSAKERAYAAALAVASRSSMAVSDENTDARRIAKERSAERSVDDLNSMYAKAFATVYK